MQFTLRARLVLLLLFVLLPSLVLTFFSAVAETQRATENVQTNALWLAKASASALSHEINQSHALLTELANRLNFDNPEQCSAYLADLLPTMPLFTGISVANANGDVFCSAAALSAPLNIADRSFFKRALQTGRFAIGEYQVGRVSGRPLLSFGYPVYGGDDELRALISLGMELEWLNNHLSNMQLPEEAAVTVLDRNGTIVSHYPDAADWAGKTVPEAPVMSIVLTQQSEGTAEVAGVDNTVRLYAYTPIMQAGDSGLYLTVGIPTSAAYAQVESLILLSLMNFALIILLGSVAIWVGTSRLILGYLNIVLTTLKRIQGGDLSARTHLAHGPPEIQHLATAFDDMVNSLQQREERKELAEAAVRRSAKRLETLHMIDRGVLTGKAPQEIAEKVLEHLWETMNCQHISAVTFDFPVNQAILLGRITEAGLERVDESERRFPIAYLGPLDDLKLGRNRIIEDVGELEHSDPAVYQNLLATKTQSVISIPLIAQGELVGMLSLRSGATNTFRLEQLQVAQEVADQLALAIQQTNLRGELQRYAAELEERVEQRTTELRRTKDQVEAILNNSSDAILLTSTVGLIQRANPAFSRLFGYNGDETSHLSLVSLIEPNSIAAFNRVFDEVVYHRLPKRVEIVCHRKDGSLFDADVAISRATNHDTEQMHIICSLRDITESKQAEKLIFAREQEFKALADNAPDIIARFDKELRHLYINPAIESVTSISREHYLGRTNIELGMPPSLTTVWDAALRDVFETGKTGVLEFDFVTHDERTLFYNSRLVPEFTPEGAISSVLGVSRDVTDNKRAEEELRKALEAEIELNGLKTRFVSMVSHDFRTPLAVIQSSSGILKDYTDRLSEEKKVGHLDKIQIQVNRLADMLDDIMILSRAQNVGLEYKPKPLELVEFCEHLARELEDSLKERKHQIQFQSHSTFVDPVMDEKLMRQMFINLLNNAIKYSPSGGVVRFELRCVDDEGVFTIQDNGIGIPEKDQTRLFETFHRAGNVGDIAGTGLGLAIVKQAVDAHHGSISFISEVGIGTTFTVTLPLHPPS